MKKENFYTYKVGVEKARETILKKKEEIDLFEE